MMNNRFFVHISGRDDILGPFDEITAYRKANEINSLTFSHNSEAENIDNILTVICIVITENYEGYEYLKDY